MDHSPNTSSSYLSDMDCSSDTSSSYSSSASSTTDGSSCSLSDTTDSSLSDIASESAGRCLCSMIALADKKLIYIKTLGSSSSGDGGDNNKADEQDPFARLGIMNAFTSLFMKEHP